MTDSPMYQQIADSIREQIADGRLAEGAEVREADIVRDWKVARQTARAALDDLEGSGLVSGRPLRVTRYRQRVIHLERTDDLTWAEELPSPGADAWLGDISRAGHEPGYRPIKVGPVVPGTDVTTRLELAAGMSVIERELLRLVDRKPDNKIRFWFPRDVADGTLLAEPDSIREGSLAWLEKTYGPLEHSRYQLSARMPDPHEKFELRIPPGWPVMVVWRVSQSPKHQPGPVVTSMAIHPADRTELVG